MSKRRPKDEFEELKDYWNKVLEQTGFDDIESPNGSIKRWSSSVRLQTSEVYRESKEEYYRLAGQFYHEYPFTSELEKETWRLHSEGFSIREIADRFKSHGVKTNKNKVNEVITTLTNEMMRMYVSR